jgi:hypothetical protein
MRIGGEWAKEGRRKQVRRREEATFTGALTPS